MEKTKNVIVIRPEEPSVFEQAIFIVRDSCIAGNIEGSDELVCEAQRIAGKFMTRASPKPARRVRVPSALLLVLGAAAGAALCALFMGIK